MSPSPSRSQPLVRAMIRRGESKQTTLTGDPASYPTSPPASTQHHGHVPEIAGSSGGFLGLVIGLGALIIASCVGVYILLKKRKDRGEPLWRSTKSRAGVAPSDEFIGRSPSVFARMKGHGWIRTGEGDGEDDFNNRSTSYQMGSGTRARSRSPNPRPDSDSGSGPTGPYAHSQSASSVSTVRLSAPGGGPHDDAFSARDSIDSLAEAETPRGFYQDGGLGKQVHKTTNYSPTSPDSITKFRESL